MVPVWAVHSIDEDVLDVTKTGHTLVGMACRLIVLALKSLLVQGGRQRLPWIVSLIRGGMMKQVRRVETIGIILIKGCPAWRVARFTVWCS